MRRAPPLPTLKDLDTGTGVTGALGPATLLPLGTKGLFLTRSMMNKAPCTFFTGFPGPWKPNVHPRQRLRSLVSLGTNC